MADGVGQVLRFIVVGVLATASDALVYAGLLAAGVGGVAGIADHDVAKACSFVVGTCVAYALNKGWTFRAPGADVREAASFFALYGFTFVLNVGVHHGLRAALPDAGWVGPVAFVGATGCSTVANFLGQRLWVFRRHVEGVRNGDGQGKQARGLE